jgi:hypothetical protein
MNSLQSELDSINSQLELLTYRKTQLDSIMGEYSEVINRVKSLIGSMEDAMIEPVNLLMEIEGLIHGPEFEAVLPTPEPPLLAFLQSQPLETIQDIHPSDDKPIHEYIIDNKAVCHPPNPDTDSDTAIIVAGNVTQPKPEAKQGTKRYPNNIYWDNESGVRVFIPKKRRFKSELEAIAKVCIEQGYSTKFEIIECDGDWLVMFSQVLSESSVQGIINNFYPQHTDGEPATETKPELTQLNARAWRRENTLLIGFSNKRLLNVWSNWFKSSWSGQIHISENNDKLEGFEHCLGILWYGTMPELKRWERLANLDYAFKPDEQQGIVKAV